MLVYYSVLNFSYIHSYLNYANIAWANTRIAKLKKLLVNQCLRHNLGYKQKIQAIRRNQVYLLLPVTP